MLTETQIKTLQVRLLEEKEKVEIQLKKINEGLDFGDDVDHFEEESDEAEEITNRLPVNSSLKSQLEEIDVALDKIKNKTYGKCENCSEEISFKLLEIDPESALCQNCKKLAK